MLLNLIFHHISTTPLSDDHWAITPEKYWSVIDMINQLIKTQKVPYEDYRIYFDDGYSSFYDFIYKDIPEKELSRYTLAIVTDDVDTPNHMTLQQLKEIHETGIHMSSHGVSHASIAIYIDNVIQTTPLGGIYQNCPWGQGKALSEREVLYQLQESKKFLEKYFGIIDEFVFPFGIYNNQVIALNDKYGLYRYMSTCDEVLDHGQFLRPRYLIYNTKSMEQIKDELMNIKNQYELL